MDIVNYFSIKSKTYLLVLLSVVVALILSVVSKTGLDAIRTELEYLVFSTKIERYTNKLIHEEQNYRLNANGSVYNVEQANQAYESAILYVDKIYQTLDEIEGTRNSESIYTGVKEDPRRLRLSTDEYKNLYLKAVALLTDLNKQAAILENEGEYITKQIQEYVESKRVEIKDELSQKTIEKINNGSNIWQFTYVTRLDEKKYRLNPDETIFTAFKNDYQFMMSEWQRLKDMSDQDFEFEKLEEFHTSAIAYESAMLSWVDLNRQLTDEVLPGMKSLGASVISRAIDSARRSVDQMSETRNNIALTLIVVTVLTILMGLLFGSLIARSISRVVTSFQDGLLNFFQYLNQQQDEARPITVKGRDEISVMARVVNENINNIKSVLERKSVYQQALLEWSKVDYLDDNLTINKATELSAKALHIERVSVWLLNDDKSALNCTDLYLSIDDSHESGAVLNRDDFPSYFKAIESGEILVANNARKDSRTAEFTESYLEPMNIYSMLDLPIIQDGKTIGVVCLEKTNEYKEWQTDEQEFAGSLANAIALSLEIKKRRVIQEELKNQKDILHHQAHHDTLTDLPNRFLFNDRLKQSIKQAQRSDTKIAVLFIDLDNFKSINDSMGHKVGDELLIEVARRLKSKIRQTDTLARLGGDEFSIVLNDIANNDVVVSMTQNLLSTMNTPIELAEQSFYVTFSIGVVIYPDDGDTPDVLLKNADAAMYQAKDEGRNSYQFYDQAMTEKAFERIAMEAGFRKALEKEEFVVLYQPQVDAETGKYVGVEALVRWNHPEMGMITPDKFLMFAYETGLIVPLDRWVMKTSMRQIARWYAQGLEPGVLALNLSVRQLRNDDCVDDLRRSMEETGCKPEWLELEITEEEIMIDTRKAIMVLNQIKELGIKLAIDDFGTGYSSLSQLKRLPINKLKIDRSFIRDLPDDEEDKAISKTIIALAHNMGLNVVAEGVETESQKDFLLQNGCKHVQGYLYSKPVAASEIESRFIEQAN